MPGFDRTGPMGQGSKTGWGAGLCQDNLAPGRISQMTGRGFGRGRMRGQGFGSPGFGGRGMGMRRGIQYAGLNSRMDAMDERAILENQKDILKNQLNETEQRLETIALQESGKNK